MLSSFRTLRALLVAVSSSSLALSLSSSGESALSKRSFAEYVDNLIYLDANKTSLYASIELGGESYAAFIDNKWDGLLVHGASVSGNASTLHSITVQDISVQVEDDRGEVGILEDDVQNVEFFTVTDWPSTMPEIDVADVGNAYIGLDINNGMSPIYAYFDARWPEDYSKWYYDIILTYDWADANATGVDFAGVLVAGQTLNWTDLLSISQSQVDSYGLPSLAGIDQQSPIYLLADGTFYIDSTFTANGQQTSFVSQVPKVDSGKLVADVYYSNRWSTFPDSVVKALYGSISGATYVAQSTFGYWQIPCDAQPSFSFSINGTAYSLNTDALVAFNPWGEQCIGSLFTKGQAVAAVPEFDVVFGFQFMSSFYYRAGIEEQTDRPYYKFLPLQMPTGGLDPSGAASSAPALSYVTTASGVASTASAASVTSAYSATTIRGSSTGIAASSTSVAASSTSAAVSSSGTPADKAAGNLAAEDSSDNDDASYWKKQADNFKLIMIILAAVSGVLLLALIGGAFAFFSAKRKNESLRPSAYRSLHDAESNEPKASLYDAEGGHSRYSDPYQDNH